MPKPIFFFSDFVDKLKSQNKYDNLNLNQKDFIAWCKPMKMSCRLCQRAKMIRPEKLISQVNSCKYCFPNSGTFKSNSVKEMQVKIHQMYGDQYIIDFSKYIRNTTRLPVRCTKCNTNYSATYSNMTHHKRECTYCFRLKLPEISRNSAKKRTMKFQDFITRAKAIHQDRYKYDESSFTMCKNKTRLSCNKCDKVFQTTADNVLRGHGCFCYTAHESKSQIEIFNLLKVNSPYKWELNKRDSKDYEFDIFCPEQKLAIEYHGLYWHSSFYKTKNYHQKKYLQAKEKGIKLIQIFEHEWVKKREIVLSILNNYLSVNQEIIYARKCKIVTLTSKVANQFLEQNHLQGTTKAKYYYGLEHENKLVSVIAFAKPSVVSNRQHKDTWDIARYACKLNTNVVGGFARLEKHFINEVKPKQIDTFADTRYFSGNVYLNQGYKLQHLTTPNYFYFFYKSSKLETFHRFTFTKSRIKNKLPIFDEAKTEQENMLANGFVSVYDSGHLLFSKVIN